MSAAFPSRFQRLARGIVVVAICLSLGLQWAALQGIAWTGMLITYYQQGSLVDAVAKTFDGEHPCPLCKAVKKGSGKQSPDGVIKNAGKKMDALIASLTVLVAPSGERLRYPAWEARALRRATPPPGKPPRIAL
ncbi:MAG: hypothetical protein U0984_13250, partial [Prosthecobacter sp.]|nr:hypothetical protein [Prosthecobacter sp.]